MVDRRIIDKFSNKSIFIRIHNRLITALPIRYHNILVKTNKVYKQCFNKITNYKYNVFWFVCDPSYCCLKGVTQWLTKFP